MKSERKTASLTRTILRMHVTLDICIINKTLNFHYRKRTTGGAEQLSYYAKYYRKRSSRATGLRLFFDPVLIFGASEQNLPPPHYIRENPPHPLPRRSFRTYPFSPLLTSDYRLPRASFRTCATRSGTSARSR